MSPIHGTSESGPDAKPTEGMILVAQHGKGICLGSQELQTMSCLRSWHPDTKTRTHTCYQTYGLGPYRLRQDGDARGPEEEAKDEEHSCHSGPLHPIRTSICDQGSDSMHSGPYSV